MYRYDFTEQYNFNNEMKKRGTFTCDGIEAGRVDLGDGFYASLMQTEFETKNQYRVTVWLSHTDCEEKVYAFTMMLGVACSVNDADVVNTVRVKFRTNYANLKKAYKKKHKMN